MKILSFTPSAFGAAVLAAAAVVFSPLAVAGQQAPPPRKLKKACNKNMVTKNCATMTPTKKPTKKPTPVRRPTKKPFVNRVPAMPTRAPTKRPTRFPTALPTRPPTSAPSSVPSSSPTQLPSSEPTRRPTASPVKGLPTTCPGVAGTMVSHNGHVYGYVPLEKTWDDADAFARTLTCCETNGHLVTITTSGEKAVMETVLTTIPNLFVWIGMYENNGKWVWTGADGEVDTVTIMTSSSFKTVFTGTVGIAGALPGALVYTYSARADPSVIIGSIIEFDC